MKPIHSMALGLVMAAALSVGTLKGAVTLNSPGATAAQDDNQALMLRPLEVADAPTIDQLKLVEKAGQPTLLYSTDVEPEAGHYQLVIRSAPVADITRATEVARIDKLLPARTLWDARPVGDRYEILYEMATGAMNDILFRDVQGDVRRVSSEHELESFSRPHFVRLGTGAVTSDVGAVAELKNVVVFPGGTTDGAKYVVLADGADGIVGGNTERWVVSKDRMSGATLFNTLPGRLTLSRVGATNTSRTTVPDVLAYEFDAAPLGNDFVIFATSKPAFLLLGRRPERPYRFSADDRSALLWLSRPTILVTAQFVHVAALLRPGTDQAAILYAAVPLGALASQ